MIGHSRLQDSSPTGVPAVSLQPDPALSGGDPVNPLAAQMLPERVCRHFRMLPISADGRTLVIAMADPSDRLAQDVASALAPDPVRVVLAPAHQIDAAIDRVFGDLGHPDSLAPPLDIVSPGRIGEILVTRGLISEGDLADALDTQARTGSRIGEILHHAGKLSESGLAAALADQLRVPLVDLEGIEASAEALASIPESLQREGRCAPLAVDDEVLYLAVTDPLDDTTYEEIRGLTDLRIRSYVVLRSQLDALLRRTYRVEHLRAARAELLTRFPEDSANRVLSAAQRALLVILALLAILALVLAPRIALIVLVVLCAAIPLAVTLARIKLALGSLRRRGVLRFASDEVAEIPDRELPRYSILVPLFREARLIPRLAESMRRLDYPVAKLEILLLCEEGDEVTLGVIKAAALPPCFQLLVVPRSQPRTKAKACNYGLQQATGEIVVVYDADSRPEPDQLKKALLAFERAEDGVVSVQCRIACLDARRSLLTRLYALERALRFEVLLPGLAAAGSPVPLAGTSYHFNRQALIDVGAWDPFNVAADTDLGVRLRKAGYATAMLDSTTRQEAPMDAADWLRQRSRRVKGDLQTYLVHMRHPLRLMRALGFGAWWSFQLLVGGAIAALLAPILVGLGALLGLTLFGLLEPPLPEGVLLAAVLTILACAVAGACLLAVASARGGLGLGRYALLAPIHWTLTSAAGWRGAYQLGTKPFLWEKTDGGLDVRRA